MLMSRLHFPIVVQPRSSPGLAAARSAWLPIALAWLLAAPGPAAGQPASAPAPLYEAALLPGVVCRIAPDGALAVVETAGGRTLLTLQAAGDPGPSRGRGAEAPEAAFARVVGDGAAGGARGFSLAADDDRDGTRDEDPLDGLDNDRDGWTDEDYAAVGDTMVVVHTRGPGPHLQREFYRWTGANLRPAIFLSVRKDDSAYPAALQLRSGGPWLQAEIASYPHAGDGQPQALSLRALVTNTTAAAGAGEVWLGLLMLSEVDGGGGLPRSARDVADLDIEIGGEGLPLAVCAASSWLQLCSRLGEATLAYRGVADPMSGRRVKWIAPARCVRCRQAEPAVFRWTWTAQAGVILWVDPAPGANPMLDPDLVRVNGLPLGSPLEAIWTAPTGERASVPWTACSLRDVRAGTTSAQGLAHAIPTWWTHTGGGRFALRYDTVPDAVRDLLLRNEGPEGGLALSGRSVCGRTIDAELRYEIPGPSTAAADRAPRGAGTDLLADRGKLRLSPELLKGWPNPFRDRIRILFRVPRTLQEAFVWEDGAPVGLDLQAAVPWRGGAPQATVKIYNMEGHELATLFDGGGAAGEVTLTWDGKDAYGRPVASGTYFCKLQLDDLSVTRRIVYLR